MNSFGKHPTFRNPTLAKRLEARRRQEDKVQAEIIKKRFAGKNDDKRTENGK